MFLTTGHLPAQVRPVVAQSWRRCVTRGVDPASTRPPLDLSEDELRAYREAHPLAGIMPVVRSLLVEDATEAGPIVAVSDTAGRLLWVEGEHRLRSRAERMRFVEGAQWSEESAGTNAPGTALALDQPVQLYGSEHLSDPVTSWSCAAAPIHDPDTGALLGALDLTGGDDVAAPHALTLVRAAAAAVESDLRLHRLLQQRDRPGGPAAGRPPATVRRPPPVARAALQPARVLRVLGRDRGRLATPSGALDLSPRHTELLLLLAHHPNGLTTERLAILLHERDAAAVTLRAEFSRLRALLGRLGEPVLASRPYRLTGGLMTDAHTVRQLIDRGAYRRALAAYPGPVLPASQAPAVRVLRDRLAQDLRACVLGSGDADVLWTYLQRPEAEDDVEAWQACLRRLPRGSRRRPVVAARLERLDRELGLG